MKSNESSDTRTYSSNVAFGSPSLHNADLTPAGRAELFDNTCWGKLFAWSQIQTLAEYVGAYKVHKGDVIFHEGDKEAYMCLVSRGKVRILKEDSAHEKKLITILGKGQTFGEMSLIDGEIRSATAIAADDTILLVLSETAFERLADKAPQIALQLLMSISKLMSRRLRMTTGMLVECFNE